MSRPPPRTLTHRWSAQLGPGLLVHRHGGGVRRLFRQHSPRRFD